MKRPSPRARFIAEVAELAGELYDAMETLAKGEIARAKSAVADALREKLTTAFAKDEVAIRMAAEPIDSGHAMASWQTAQPRMLDDRTLTMRGVSIPGREGTYEIEVVGPPMRGKCSGCGTDLDQMVADGKIGHLCNGIQPKTSRLDARRVARGRRNATPPPVSRQAVAPAGITDELVATNPFDDLERLHQKRNGSGQPPVLGMRTRERVQHSRSLLVHREENGSGFDMETWIEDEKWSPEEIRIATVQAEARKLEGELPELRSSWLLGDAFDSVVSESGFRSVTRVA